MCLPWCSCVCPPRSPTCASCVSQHCWWHTPSLHFVSRRVRTCLPTELRGLFLVVFCLFSLPLSKWTIWVLVSKCPLDTCLLFVFSTYLSPSLVSLLFIIRFIKDRMKHNSLAAWKNGWRDGEQKNRFSFLFCVWFEPKIDWGTKIPTSLVPGYFSLQDLPNHTSKAANLASLKIGDMTPLEDHPRTRKRSGSPPSYKP